MTDFTWYSRLLVWVGALVLLIEGTVGHPYAVVTVLAVIGLIVGLLGFIGGLSFEGLGMPAWPVQAPIEDIFPTPAVAPSSSAWAPPASARESRVSTPPEVPASVAEAGATVPEPVSAVAQTPLRSPAPASARQPSGAMTADLAADDPSVGRACLRCHEPLRAGQTVARCPECGGIHHATCWLSNHFHCARDGCGGHGSLQAPSE